MRKLILTSYTAILANERFTENRLVVVNHSEGEVENDLMVRAVRHVEAWLKVERPHLQVISIIAYPTIGDDPESVVLPLKQETLREPRLNLAAANEQLQAACDALQEKYNNLLSALNESPFVNWKEMNVIPIHGTEFESESVVIDLNGKQEVWAIGYYDKVDDKWVIENMKEYFELDHARYANLPYNK